MLRRCWLVALLAVAGCYGPPTPDSCYARYEDPDTEGYRVCMANYRRRNGLATDADWYLLESRRAKRGRRAPDVLVSVAQSAPPPAAPPPNCKRWQCELADGGQVCACLDVADLPQ